MSVYTLTLEVSRVHLDNGSREGDTCTLLLSQDYIDMDEKVLNKIKGDEVIKKLHSVQTKACLSQVSS
jgi:hypothetical protein